MWAWGHVSRMKRDRKGGERGKRERGNKASKRRTNGRLSIRKHDAFYLHAGNETRDAHQFTYSNSYLPGSISKEVKKQQIAFSVGGALHLFIFLIFFSPSIYSPTDGGMGTMTLCYTGSCNRLAILSYNYSLFNADNRQCVVRFDSSPDPAVGYPPKGQGVHRNASRVREPCR